MDIKKGQIMTNILTKPYTGKDYADFVVLANSNGQRVEQDDNAVYAFYEYEELQNGQIVDVSNTDDYKVKKQAQENAIKKADLQSQIDDIDKKRVRAICEPAIKDSTIGQTWLDYYNQQTKDLRAQIASL